MSRLTQKDLERQLHRINERLGRPTEPYTRVAGEEGRGPGYQPNGGCLHLSGAYGGWQVHEMMATGGVRSVTSGYEPLRVVSTYLDGMEASLDALLPRDEYGRVLDWDVTYKAVPR